MRFHPHTIARSSCLALALLAAGCGKSERASTGAADSGVVASAPVRVSKVGVGRTLGADKRLTDETDEFRLSDTIYAVVETKGSGPNTVLQARWTFEDGQVVDESSRSIAARVEDVTEFHISKPGAWPKGKYKVEILLNGAAVESEDFEVK